jgi:hypothetical protein
VAGRSGDRAGMAVERFRVPNTLLKKGGGELLHRLSSGANTVWKPAPPVVVLPDHLHAIWSLPPGDDGFPRTSVLPSPARGVASTSPKPSSTSGWVTSSSKLLPIPPASPSRGAAPEGPAGRGSTRLHASIEVVLPRGGCGDVAATCGHSGGLGRPSSPEPSSASGSRFPGGWRPHLWRARRKFNPSEPPQHVPGCRNHSAP